MFFVIDKPRLQRIIAIVRDDRTRKTQGSAGPYMRLEARDGQLTLNNGHLLLGSGVVKAYSENEPVQLRFGQRKSTAMLSRVPGRQQEEGLGGLVSNTIHGYLALLHSL